MSRGLVHSWIEREVDHKSTVIIGSDKGVFSKGLRNVLTVELGVEFLIKVNTVSGDFKSVNSSCFIYIVEGIVIEEFA